MGCPSRPTVSRRCGVPLSSLCVYGYTSLLSDNRKCKKAVQRKVQEIPKERALGGCPSPGWEVFRGWAGTLTEQGSQRGGRLTPFPPCVPYGVCDSCDV